MRINIQCRCGVGMSHKVLQNFDIHFLFYHFSTGTSDWIEAMNETIKHDIIKPTNKGGEKNWSRERLLILSTAVVKRRQDEKIGHRKSSIRSKVEHVFRIIKCQFGYKKSRLSRIKEKRKSFVCPVCLCQFVFAGDCRLKTFHNINQGGSLPFYRKESS